MGSKEGQEIVTIDLGDTFLQERNREHAVLHADPHQLGRVSADITELDTLLLYHISP